MADTLITRLREIPVDRAEEVQWFLDRARQPAAQPSIEAPAPLTYRSVREEAARWNFVPLQQMAAAAYGPFQGRLVHDQHVVCIAALARKQVTKGHAQHLAAGVYIQLKRRIAIAGGLDEFNRMIREAREAGR